MENALGLLPKGLILQNLGRAEEAAKQYREAVVKDLPKRSGAGRWSARACGRTEECSTQGCASVIESPVEKQVKSQRSKVFRLTWAQHCRPSHDFLTFDF
jgi:hypothetical protein